jgi:hypothetical protein
VSDHIDDSTTDAEIRATVVRDQERSKCSWSAAPDPYRQYPREVAQPSPALSVDIEAISAKVHESWMAEKRAAGFHGPEDICPTTNLLPRERFGCCKKYHADMIPYDELTDDKKELDRATVRTVLNAMAYAAHSGSLPTLVLPDKEHTEFCKLLETFGNLEFECGSWPDPNRDEIDGKTYSSLQDITDEARGAVIMAFMELIRKLRAAEERLSHVEEALEQRKKEQREDTTTMAKLRERLEEALRAEKKKFADLKALREMERANENPAQF